MEIKKGGNIMNLPETYSEAKLAYIKISSNEMTIEDFLQFIDENTIEPEKQTMITRTFVKQMGKLSVQHYQWINKNIWSLFNDKNLHHEVLIKIIMQILNKKILVDENDIDRLLLQVINNSYTKEAFFTRMRKNIEPYQEIIYPVMNSVFKILCQCVDSNNKRWIDGFDYEIIKLCVRLHTDNYINDEYLKKVYAKISDYYYSIKEDKSLAYKKIVEFLRQTSKTKILSDEDKFRLLQDGFLSNGFNSCMNYLERKEVDMVDSVKLMFRILTENTVELPPELADQFMAYAVYKKLKNSNNA